MPNFLAVKDGFSYFAQMSKETGIYFVGDLVIDQVPHSSDPRSLQWMPGGSMYFGSIGAAIALKNLNLLEVGSYYVGPLANDHFGREALEDFVNAGVNTDYTVRSDFSNIFAAVSEDGNGGNKYAFYTRHEADTGKESDLSNLPSRFKEENRIFVFGDIVSAMDPMAETIFCTALERSGKNDIILFDPNTRPPVVANIDNYRANIEEWAKTASIIKASEEDIEFIYPNLTQDQVAERWLKFGLSAIFVTHGSKGCSIYNNSEKRLIEGIKDDRIKRTIGAGDNFNAGIAVELAKRDLTKSFALSALPISDWMDIAAGANHIAYRHLLRTNGLG